ncbi:hypothetical protein NX059_000396 [Plenodomus lindquistii]|nr:hypothetical protein NX059_000396 [Plenodomus lindquistii]
MPRPKRAVMETIEATMIPPDTLPPSHHIARVVKAEGKNIYRAQLPDGKEVLAELEAKFRSTVWTRRGGFVVVDMSTMADRDNKLDGEIVNIVREEKEWRKMPYWPKEFVKKSTYIEDSDDEESTVGKMPPADSDED